MGLWKKAKDYIKKSRETYRSVTEKDVIALALQHGNKLTAAVLATRTQLSVQQAARKLSTLSMKGVFHIKYSGGNDSNLYTLKNPELFQDLTHHPASPVVSMPSEKKLTDADVISAAVKSKGRLIPGVLCIHAQVSIDLAKKKLQELQHKGIFDVEAESSGAIVYILNHYHTYQNMMDDSEQVIEE